MSKQPKEMCDCVVYHQSGNWHEFARCSFRAKEAIDVETAPSWHEQQRGKQPEPRTIKVCGVHARELRKGKTVDRITGWSENPYRRSPKWEDVRLPNVEDQP